LNGIAQNVVDWSHAESFNFKALWKTSPKLLRLSTTPLRQKEPALIVKLFTQAAIGLLGINFVVKVS
jgi:hypothetical protein